MDKHTEELLSQILANTNKISNTLEKHSKILDNHTKILNEHTNILNEHSNRLANLEKTSTNHGGRLQNIENITAKLEVEHGQRLQNIENIVTKIEAEHGEKLQVLFDYFTTDSTRFADIKKEISKINTTLDNYDNRIYYLEFHKNKLSHTK